MEHGAVGGDGLPVEAEIEATVAWTCFKGQPAVGDIEISRAELFDGKRLVCVGEIVWKICRRAQFLIKFMAWSWHVVR